MLFEFDQLPATEQYKLLASVVVPRPIAWVTSADEDGRVNVAPFSFFNALAGSPPLIGIGIAGRDNGTAKDSGRNIARSGEWVVNMVSHGNAEAMNVTAADFPPEVSEVEQAGLRLLPSVRVDVPRLAESPAALECRLWRQIDVSDHQMIVLGEVVAMHIRDDAMLNPQRHHVDTPALDLIGRMHGGGWYVRCSDRFEIKRLRPEDV